MERDLTDAHSWIERNWQAGDVAELQRKVPYPSWIDVPSGGVNQQAESSE